MDIREDAAKRTTTNTKSTSNTTNNESTITSMGTAPSTEATTQTTSPTSSSNTPPTPETTHNALPGTPTSSPVPSSPVPTRKLTTMKQSYMCCNNRFLLLHKLGKGGFGLIYSGVDLLTNKEIAIKLEDMAKAKKKYLKQEFQIYQRYHSDWSYLPFNQKATLPSIYYYGRDGGYRVLVMDLLGPSLSELFTFQYERFTLKTVCMLGIKMITAVEHLHAKGLLHRDIKPGNFVMGRGLHGNDLYLIDYGLASPYIDEKGEHIAYSNTARFHGTDKYASINNHKKIEPGRRDDMESLGYLLVYFLTGNLPWSRKNPRVKKKNRRSVYGKSKKETTIEELTQGCPPQFAKFFKHVFQLYFADKPNYDYYRQLFNEALTENSHACDEVFDWSIRDSADSGATSANTATTTSTTTTITNTNNNINNNNITITPITAGENATTKIDITPISVTSSPSSPIPLITTISSPLLAQSPNQSPINQQSPQSPSHPNVTTTATFGKSAFVVTTATTATTTAMTTATTTATTGIIIGTSSTSMTDEAPTVGPQNQMDTT